VTPLSPVRCPAHAYLLAWHGRERAVTAVRALIIRGQFGNLKGYRQGLPDALPFRGSGVFLNCAGGLTSNRLTSWWRRRCKRYRQLKVVARPTLDARL
jgi:hypothetical protein